MAINELELQENCERYNCEYRHFGDTAVIFTGMDTWKVDAIQVYEDEEVVEKIKVKHLNSLGNSTGKMQFHSQRYAYDLDYIFSNIIIPHEQSDWVYNKAFRIKELLAQTT